LYNNNYDSSLGGNENGGMTTFSNVPGSTNYLSTFEEQLLKDYGKVFYYKIEVFDPANILVFESYMMPDNNYEPDNLYWNLTGVDHITPIGDMVPMVYNFDRSNNSTLSDEIVLDKAYISGEFESEMTFMYLMWNMKVTVHTDLNGMYVKLDDF